MQRLALLVHAAATLALGLDEIPALNMDQQGALLDVFSELQSVGAEENQAFKKDAPVTEPPPTVAPLSVLQAIPADVSPASSFPQQAAPLSMSQEFLAFDALTAPGLQAPAAIQPAMNRAPLLPRVGQTLGPTFAAVKQMPRRGPLESLLVDDTPSTPSTPSTPQANEVSNAGGFLQWPKMPSNVFEAYTRGLRNHGARTVSQTYLPSFSGTPRQPQAFHFNPNAPSAFNLYQQRLHDLESHRRQPTTPPQPPKQPGDDFAQRLQEEVTMLSRSTRDVPPPPPPQPPKQPGSDLFSMYRSKLLTTGGSPALPPGVLESQVGLTDLSNMRPEWKPAAANGGAGVNEHVDEQAAFDKLSEPQAAALEAFDKFSVPQAQLDTQQSHGPQPGDVFSTYQSKMHEYSLKKESAAPPPDAAASALAAAQQNLLEMPAALPSDASLALSPQPALWSPDNHEVFAAYQKNLQQYSQAGNQRSLPRGGEMFDSYRQHLVALESQARPQ